MIKTYSLKKDGNISLSAHFKIREFACKDGSDKILIDTDLIPMIEKLRQKLGASAFIIYSGYRTPAHDKKVGGGGSGPHTQGYAVDCYLLDKKKKKIDAQKICAVAGDLGFKGIGYINKVNLHLDTKPRHWWGDETVTTSYGIEKINGSKDFYEYFNIKKESDPIDAKKYIQIKAKGGVWAWSGIGFKTKKQMVIPNGSKCELITKNVGKANGYNWDKIIYKNKTLYLANNWNKYL
ncbi:MAG: D-Ala-D-Ala carboxypeptidase family metallohydrolase [Bacilli bacterium]|nr:D-Ala-D-Ala carboxypeptidase family metallohydrolase [Bacilli bacterium]